MGATVVLKLTAQITKMPGRVDQGFVAIGAVAINAAICGSILAEPEACSVTRITLPQTQARWG